VFPHVIIACVSLITVASVCFAAACNRSPAQSSTAKVDKLFAEWNRQDSPGCSVGVSRNGFPVYERGYGMANVELTYAISVRDSGLVMQIPGRPEIVLAPVVPDTFHGSFIDVVKFSRDARGVRAFSIQTSGVRNLTFTK
jgi:hypothetical protein